MFFMILKMFKGFSVTVIVPSFSFVQTTFNFFMDSLEQINVVNEAPAYMEIASILIKKH